VKFALIDVERAGFPVSFMCEQLGVSRSGYYAWKEREPSKHEADDEKLSVDVVKVHLESRRAYGSLRVYRELKAQGQRTSRKRIARVMKEKGLVAKKRRRFRQTTDSRHAFPVAPDLVHRAFDVDEPNKVWVTDITYLWTREGWVYLAAIIDLYSRRCVGWAMSATIDTQLCLAALRMALAAREPGPGRLIHHSDRGGQYASDLYRRTLVAEGIECSMSRKGNCWDNAVAESFWSTLKTELVDGAVFETRAVARQAVFEYIEVFYNRRRRHSSIGYVSPAERESKYALSA
jgi:putative transposase